RSVDIWMALRDRRGPLTALVLTAAYTLLVIEMVLIAARAAGWDGGVDPSPLTKVTLGLCVAALAWRAAMRMAFTWREYGWMDGLRAVFRIPVGNVIAIMASRRAFAAYLRALRGAAVAWDKTAHKHHPALPTSPEPQA
ncbi:MAG: hypothetical protein ABIQ81_03160, partial [Novosphingobium sp.]